MDAREIGAKAGIRKYGRSLWCSTKINQRNVVGAPNLSLAVLSDHPTPARPVRPSRRGLSHDSGAKVLGLSRENLEAQEIEQTHEISVRRSNADLMGQQEGKRQ